MTHVPEQIPNSAMSLSEDGFLINHPRLFIDRDLVRFRPFDTVSSRRLANRFELFARGS